MLSVVTEKSIKTILYVVTMFLWFGANVTSDPWP